MLDRVSFSGPIEAAHCGRLNLSSTLKVRLLDALFWTMASKLVDGGETAT